MATKFTNVLRGLFIGSGSDGMQLNVFVNEIFSMAKATATKATSPPQVLYVGTATYNNPLAQDNQTKELVALGCTVQTLLLNDTVDTAKDKFSNADIIVVSGGNTLFAVDRWKHLGIHHLFKQAGERGAILTGGSAGAIVAFDSGHSDSGDPESFLHKQDGAGANHEWEYVKVSGLSWLPGLCCPHYDKVQSNGILRALDFDAMMLRHSGEMGLGIDHWSALKIDGDHYSVLSPEDKVGSVMADGSFSPTRQGKPGIWQLTVNAADNSVVRTLVPPRGLVNDLLRVATTMVDDPRIETIRTQNPATGDIGEIGGGPEGEEKSTTQ